MQSLNKYERPCPSAFGERFYVTWQSDISLSAPAVLVKRTWKRNNISLNRSRWYDELKWLNDSSRQMKMAVTWDGEGVYWCIWDGTTSTHVDRSHSAIQSASSTRAPARQDQWTMNDKCMALAAGVSEWKVKVKVEQLYSAPSRHTATSEALGTWRAPSSIAHTCLIPSQP